MHRVLEGFRREVTAEERCRRADIEPNKLYSRTEGFMGQASSVRVETWSEPPLYGIDRLEWQSADLKDLVAELSLDLHRLKKRRYRVYAKASPTQERRREGSGPSEG